LGSEVEEIIKGMKDKKATGDDDVPEHMLKMLEEESLRIETRLINKLYETGEWTKNLLKLKCLLQIRSQMLQNAATITQSVSSHIQQRL
jgi:hypothetical protein